MKIRVFAGLTGASLFAIASAAAAQAADSIGASPSSTEAWKLEEIVVTARRRDESLQDVPQTVTAVTADAIEKLNLLKFEDVQAVVPGLTLTSNSTGFGAAASLRGVSFTSESQTTPTVEFYLDDAPIESNFMFQSMFDVGQIEVLRGPQGTLRGRASPSGAITLTTRKASLSEFGGYAMASGSDQSSYNAQGAINVPIVADVLAVRVAGVYDENQYDQVRSVNLGTDPESKTKGARLNVTFQPIDSITANLSYQYLKRNVTSFIQVAGTGSPGQTGGLVLAGGGPRFPYPLNPTLAAGFNGPAIASGDRLSVMDQPGKLRQKYDVVTANVDWHFAGQRLSYVGGYRKQDLLSLNTGDAGNLIPGVEIYQVPISTFTQRTQELRLSSEERIAERFDYTAGLFYSKTHADADVAQTASFLSGALGSPFAAPVVGFYDPRYVLNTSINRSSVVEEKSAFASLSWHLTDRTELTAGGRYIVNKVDEFTGLGLSSAQIALPLAAIAPAPSCAAAGLTSTYAGTCDVNIPASALPPITNNAEDKPFVYNVQLSHRFTADFLAYANVGTSWRRGVSLLGVNNSPSPGVPADAVLADLITLDPEKSRSYEIGFKSTFWDSRAQVNLAVYRQQYDGLIFRGTTAINYLENRGTGLQPASFQFTTSADAIVDGVDLDASFVVMPRWNVALAASYADGHVDDDTVPCNDGNLDGTPDALPPTLSATRRIALCKSDATVSAAPPWNASLQSEYSLPIASSMDGYVRGLLTYYPKNDKQEGFKADAYGLLNLYLGIRAPDNSWDISVYAKNAAGTNKTLALDISQGPSQILTLGNYFGPTGYVSTRYTSPREIGLSVRYAFGSR